MIRTASARWTGNLKEGSGTVSTETGVLKEQAYSFKSRVENVPGTNPEELAGAALAGCFTMKLSGVLSEAGLPPEEVNTTARVQLDTAGGELKIPKIELVTSVRVQGVDDAKLQELGQKAKAGCPMARLFTGAEITLQLTRG